MRAKSRALKIAYFQGLYKRYSRLDFTRSYDRPFAIAGLEKRLQVAFDSKGSYGTFDDSDKANPGLFHRSLLWQRECDGDNDRFLKIIDFPTDRNVHIPSWSWMAYEGGIDYCDPPFQTADWEMKEIVSPWSERPTAEGVPEMENLALSVTVHDFDLRGRGQNDVKLFYDTSQTTASNGTRSRCVIVARSKVGRSEREKTYYVLLVGATGDFTVNGEKVYKRLGAGFMLGKYVTLDGDIGKVY